MLLPIMAAYGLFVWISAYNEDRKVAEYLGSYVELNQLREVLEEPNLYKTNADFSAIDGLVSEHVSVTLYNEFGFMLYSTNLMKQAAPGFLQKKKLYEGFYEQQQKFGTMRYKEPIFTGSTLTGVYEIEWVRDEWVTGVNERTWFVLALFISFFILLFAGVVYLVNQKLNKPLHQLIAQMDAFAKGLPSTPMHNSDDELGELTRSFKSMRMTLIEANQKIADEQRQKEFMIASISHDLKTPLTSIRAYAEALDFNQLLVHEQREYREVIIEKSSFMRQMLDDLLTYTLLQSSTYTMDLVAVHGEEFFEMLVADYETLCDEKGIQLKVMTTVCGTYEVNAQQLIRVVDNLMINAITHTASGSTIQLAAVNTEAIPTWCFDFVTEALDDLNGMYLIVQNEGEGLAEEQLEKIFEPLYQANEARTKIGNSGTGLGLSIAKEIIDKHGGTVKMLSKQQVGTAVICYLPKMKGEEV